MSLAGWSTRATSDLADKENPGPARSLAVITSYGLRYR